MAVRFLSVSRIGGTGRRRQIAPAVLTTRANTWRMRARMSLPAAVGGWWTSALGDRYIEFSEVARRTIRRDCLGQLSSDRDHDKPPLRAGGPNQ